MFWANLTPSSLQLLPEIRSDEHIDKIYEIIADFPFVQQLGARRYNRAVVYGASVLVALVFFLTPTSL